MWCCRPQALLLSGICRLARICLTKQQESDPAVTITQARIGICCGGGWGEISPLQKLQPSRFPLQKIALPAKVGACV